MACVVVAQLVSCDLPVDEVQVGDRRYAAALARGSSGVAVHVSGAADMVAVALWQQQQVAGRAYVLVEGEQRVSRRVERVAVVSDAGALVAVLRVLVVVVRAWPGRWPAERAPFRWPLGRGGCMLIAHRGFGATWRRLGVAENTMCAFEAGFLQGLRWAEFDVQLTRDLVPMLFHDVTMAVALTDEEKPLKVTIKEIDAQQLPRLAFRPPGLQRLSRSASQAVLPTHAGEAAAVARYTVNDDFPTLEHVLRRAPAGMGFNVELKFAEWRAEEGYFVDRGLFLDTVLETVRAHGGARELVFSSFDPDLCWMAKQKQQQYPVLFLTEGGQVTTEDPRKDSLEAALEWALFAELDGIVADVESVLPQRPEVVAAVRGRGLLFFTYGGLNNDPDWVRRQRELQIDAIITDRWQVQTAIQELA